MMPDSVHATNVHIWWLTTTTYKVSERHSIGHGSQLVTALALLMHRVRVRIFETVTVQGLWATTAFTVILLIIIIINFNYNFGVKVKHAETSKRWGLYIMSIIKINNLIL